MQVSFMDQLFSYAIGFVHHLHLPLLMCIFFTAAVLRFVAYWTLKRELWFTKAFEKRAHEYVDNHMEMKHHRSFFVMTKYLLEKTYYELFVMRSIMKRRNPDHVMALSDRVFLIQQGAARIVKDTEKQAKHFRYDIHRPKMIEVSKMIVQNNPCFNRVFGIIPLSTLNDILSILPGMFIIAGIFGTFIGIMDGLPKLSGMDIADPESSKRVMDTFLLAVGHSMRSSIAGIVFSVAMTLINSLFNPYKIFVDVVERFENTLDILWNACKNNHLPSEIPNFNEHRDPIDALAEDSVIKELEGLSEYDFSKSDSISDLPPQMPKIPKAS